MAIKTANNQSMTAITALPSGVSAKSMILLATETASSSATISFTSNIDDTYSEYIFKFIDIHPATDGAVFSFQADTGTNTSYNQTTTTTYFQANHNEGDTATNLGYETSLDQAQGTAFQRIIDAIGNGNDECGAGTLHLFNPSSTTFVKHYMSNCNSYVNSPFTTNYYGGGYFNTTSAIDAVQFKMSSGNIDAGTITLYGIN